MKLVPKENFKKKIGKISDEKLFRYYVTTRNLNLGEYHELVVDEVKKRGSTKLYFLLHQGGYVE